MSPVVRSWLAFAAVAAGIIHLALAVGSAASPVLAIFGVVEFGWGLFAMAAARLVAPRVTIAGAFVAVAASVALLFIPRPPSVFALLVAVTLEFFIAIAIAIHLRRRTKPQPTTTGRYVLGLVIGGLVIAALTVPALATSSLSGYATNPGLFLNDHDH